jgi:tRNA(Ile)-lysidine synthase TilS/MesJ
MGQVLVWRPLLDHPKEAILDFAHKYGVPYFKVRTGGPQSDEYKANQSEG